MEHPNFFQEDRDEIVDQAMRSIRQHLPFYKNLIESYIHKIIYRGPLIKLPSNTSTELYCDVLACLSRTHLEKLQIISRKFCTIVDQHSHLLPRYNFQQISINYDGRDILVTIFTSSRERWESSYSIRTTKWNGYGTRCFGMFENVVFRIMEACPQNGVFDDDFWNFMERLKGEYGKIKVNRFLEHQYLNSQYVQKFLANYVESESAIVYMDPWLKNPANHSEIIKAKQIDVVLHGNDDLYGLLKRAQFPNMANFRIVYHTIDVWNKRGFFQEWMEFYSKQEDPKKLIKTIVIASDKSKHFPPEKFFEKLLSDVKSYPKKVAIKRDDIFHTYILQKTSTYQLQIKFNFHKALGWIEDVAHSVDELVRYTESATFKFKSL